MSDLDEPPAKVLKIDHINGVTHVTELSGFPVPFDGIVEEEILGEESGIIEGGADMGPEGQEEWLSEGILTDDDYNPASQETANERTDSQLTSHDEEHLESTLDSEANLAEDNTHLEDSEAHLADSSSEANLAQNEASLANSQAHLEDNEAHLADNEAHLAQSEAQLADTSFESEENVADSEANIQHGMEIDANLSFENGTHTENDPNMSLNESNLTENEANISDNIEQLMGMSSADPNDTESQTYTQEYTKLEPNTVKCGTASNLVIQRVITMKKGSSVQEIEAKTVELNIEETMKNFEGETEVKSDDFDRFLKKNTDSKSEFKTKSEPKQEQDDGNDTDDLLRMLGEDDSKSKKKLTKTVKDIRAGASGHDSSDEDDFSYEGVSVKHMKTAHSVLAKKQAAVKAKSELSHEGTDTEADEANTVQRMFGLKSGASILRQSHKLPPANILKIVEKPRSQEKPRQYHNKRVTQSLLKPTTPSPVQRSLPSKTTATVTTNMQNRTSFKPPEVKTPAQFKTAAALKAINKTTQDKFQQHKMKIESAKIKTESGTLKPQLWNVINEPGKIKSEAAKIKPEAAKIKPEAGKIKYESLKIRTDSGMIKIEPGTMRVAPEEEMAEDEYLDEEEFRMDEDEYAESDNEVLRHRQRIMRPETMDEEVPSDGESASEDGSIYDEAPSSESDDMEDWFQLDIRSEKAGDYLPLLGPRAKELLLEEKRRVSLRLSTLRQSHTALSASGKQQASVLRRATLALAEVDDMLRAA